MGRKKKKLSKPWCWYCNREFEDEKILIQHQKAKHFKCHICHKKLYTGPGLSIHCMQVHKEAIDKVPNSMPNRSNIEIEIYGMEGIPAADLKDHDRQRQGSGGACSDSDDEEPSAKKAKSEGLLGTAPAMPAGMMPGMVPGMMPPHGIPGMPPGIPMGHMMPMGPHFMHPGYRLQYLLYERNGDSLHSMPMMPPHMAMMQGQAKPLFPSAVPTSSPGATVVGADFKPITSASATISAPPTTNTSASSGASGGGENSKVATIATTGAASKIIHPAEDVSLEEIKARQPRYARTMPPRSDDVGCSSSSNAASELAVAVSAAQAASAADQAKQQEAFNTAMMQRFPMRAGPPISLAMPGAPVTSVPLMTPMRPTMIPGHPTFIGSSLMRPPPIGMPPGVIGMPPGVVYGAPVFPGMLTPMMLPRFR